MAEKTTEISTGELWARLFKAPSLNTYLTETSGIRELPVFSEYITALADARQERPAVIIERGGLNRSMGHHIFRGTRHPSRDTVIQLAFGFEMTPDETQELLKIARMTALHPKVKRDAIIAHFLYHKTGIMYLNICLSENGLPLLGGKADND